MINKTDKTTGATLTRHAGSASTLRAISTAGLVAALLCACVVEPARPPQPAPLVEVVPASPAPGYHWVKGHYRWEGNHWAWVPGHWAG